MPEMLITEPCLVNHGDDQGAVHQAAGDKVTVHKDVARGLVSANRALYTDKKDDPDKQGRNTATREMLKAADAMAKAAAAAPAAGNAGGNG